MCGWMLGSSWAVNKVPNHLDICGVCTFGNKEPIKYNLFFTWDPAVMAVPLEKQVIIDDCLNMAL